MRRMSWSVLIVVAALSAVQSAAASPPAASPVKPDEGDDLDSPVSPADLRIVRRAMQILNRPEAWNRADDRSCPAEAKRYSLYCALVRATLDVLGRFDHRGAALQQTRFTVDGLTANRRYQHRLMDYNNDASTTLADIQNVLRLTEASIEGRLATGR